jgi:hypothetical protein
MGRFSDVADAKPMTKLPHMQLGTFRTRIIHVKDVDGMRKDNTPTTYWIVEFEILESSNPEIKVGQRYGWVHDRKRAFVGPKAVKSFVAACLGIEAEDERLTGDEGDKATAAIAGYYNEDETPNNDGSGAQPMAGRELMLVCQNTLTKAKTNFTVHLWAPAA